MAKIIELIDYKCLPQILDLGQAMHDESPRYKGSIFNYDKAFGLCERLVESDRGFIAVAFIDKAKVASEDILGGPTETMSEIIGMIGGIISEDYFGDSLTACDLLMYVKPEHRGGMTAIRLAKAYEAWAKNYGVRQIQLGVSTGLEAEKTRALYNNLGFQDAGYLTLKEA